MAKKKIKRLKILNLKIVIIAFIFVFSLFTAYYLNIQTNNSSWETYHDWHSDRFTIQHPKNWMVHTEGISLDGRKSLAENLDDFEKKLTGDHIENTSIKGKPVIIQHTTDPHPFYGEIVSAYISYEKAENGQDTLLWIIARNNDQDTQGSSQNIATFKEIIETLQKND